MILSGICCSCSRWGEGRCLIPARAAHTGRDNPVPSYLHTATPSPGILHSPDPNHQGITLIPPQTCLSLSAHEFDTLLMHTRAHTPQPLLPLALPHTPAAHSLISASAELHSLQIHRHRTLPAPCTPPDLALHRAGANPGCSPASPAGREPGMLRGQEGIQGCSGGRQG